MTEPVYTTWRKSTYSDGDGNCVEVGTADEHTTIGVRNTKDRDGGTLHFTRSAWQDFIAGILAGKFDR